MHMFTEAFINEWLRFLADEIAFQERLLGQCQQLGAALVEGDRERVETCQQALVQHQSEHVDQERKRDALRLASARHVEIMVTDLRMEQIISLSPASQQSLMQQQSEALKKVLVQVQRCQERNQQLMRTSLSLINDTLAVIVGEDLSQGYQRGGGRSQAAPPRGNIFNGQA